MQDVDDVTLLIALTDNILAAQRGRPYPGLDKILRNDPTVGIPPDVRRALLSVAQEHGETFMLDRITTPVSADRNFVYCELGITFPGSIRNLYPEEDRPVAASQEDTARFFRNHSLEAPRPGADDEHFAERLFIERVVAPTLGKDGLKYIVPQEEFIDPDGKRRRIDFVLRGERLYALEVEGATYHAQHNLTPDSFDDETRRRRALSARGYDYRPFTYSEIVHGDALRAFRLMCAADSRLARLMLPVGAEGTPVADATEVTGKLLVWAPERFTQVQRALLPILASWIEAGKQEAHVLNLDARVGILNLAFEELLACSAYTARLFNLNVSLPHVIIHTRSSTPEDMGRDLSTLVLDAYLKDRLHEEGMTDRVTHVRDSVDTQPATPDAIFCVEDPRSAPVDIDGAAVYTLTKPPAVDTPPDMAALAIDHLRSRLPDHEMLDYFARRLFNIPTLKEQQVSVIQRLLAGESQFAILPTAFGKSLCFQLPGILIPGLVFVVSPLRALMRDQMYGLEARGLTCAGSIMFDDTGPEKRQKMERLGAGRYRIFYLAPERIQVMSFAQELMRIAKTAGAWALAVDEAHCVSEWGHDFRVAYLQLGRLQRALTKARDGTETPVIALTATASEKVAKDVCHYLPIPENNIIRLGSVDRKEISLSAHAVTSGANKPQILRQLIEQTVPTILGRSSLLPTDETEKKNVAAIIFAPYTDAHGQATADQNCVSVAHSLIQAGVVPEGQIKTYGSKQPHVCPECGSANTVSDWQSGGQFCRACEARFEKPIPLKGSQQQYEGYLRDVQEGFSRNEFPILVATKGFGMGIDKRNIRVIAHYAFADGLEAYIQEMGRAARDQQASHAALIYTPPTPECWHMLLTGKHESNEAPSPLCVSEEGNFRKWKCPYGLPRLCDYGMKARNIHEAYGSAETAIAHAIRVFDHLAPDPNQPLNSTVNLWPQDVMDTGDKNSGSTQAKASDETLAQLQYALYRLQVIGIVGDWFIDFEQGLKNPPVHVRLRSDWTPSFGREKAEEQLRKVAADDYSQKLESALDGIAIIDVRSHVERLVSLTVRETYHSVSGMRHDMLYFELTYALAERGTNESKAPCRRALIQQGLEDSDKTDRKEGAITSCDSCDNCRPELKFEWTGGTRTNKKDSEELAVVVSRLSQAYDSFNVDVALDLADRATSHNGAVFLQRRTEQRLTEDPFNLTAMAIAGLCARYRGLPDQAIYHFSSGYGAVERGFRDLTAGKFFYHQLRELDAPRALALLQRKGSVFDTPDGHVFAVGELKSAVEEGNTDKSSLEMAQWLRVTDEWKTQISPTLRATKATLENVYQNLHEANKADSK